MTNDSEKKETIPPVLHEGEYVLTREGSKDFGEISPETAQQIRRQAGKIRLRIGKQKSKGNNFGEKHIERPDRLRQLRENGYSSARDLVQDIAGGYTAIYDREGRGLILYKKIDRKGVSLFIELMP